MSSPLEAKYRQIQQDLKGGAVALGLVFVAGSLWYTFVEGWHWLDAVYMTTITLSTVGFGEINPLGDRGRIFTMFLIFMGLISIGYIVNRFTEALIQGYFQEGRRIRQLRRLVDSLSAHYIICGYGRTGKQIAIEFQAEEIAFVVIDSSVEALEEAKQLGYVTVLGDATLDEILMSVGVEKAACLVAALPSDAENLYTVLSAKTLNPHIRAIARASTQEALQKLQRAGADAVVSPYITGGKRMAAAALRPQVIDFVDGILTGSDRAFYMEEFLLESGTSPFIGQSLREAKLRSQSGALVLAIRRQSGELIAGPTGETVLMVGDLLICMGTPEQLRLLTQLLIPIRSDTPRLPKQS